MAYPANTDSFTPVQGTTTLVAVDHANSHNILGSAVVALENKVGLGGGSAAANQVLVGSGAGTAAWGSVWNNAVLGTPQVTGGTVSSVLNASTINGSNNTLSNLGTAMFSVGQFLRLLDNSQNWKIQYGTIPSGTISASGGVLQGTVTFPVAFTVTPFVFVCPSGGTVNSPSAGAYLTGIADTIGSTSCVVRIGNNSASGAGTVMGLWLAIGY